MRSTKKSFSVRICRWRLTSFWVTRNSGMVCCSTAPWCGPAETFDDIGFHLPAAAVLSALTIGQQQLVATARAATRGTRFLIFDEPTAYLTRSEAAQLFALIQRLKANGITIVYISHRMEEVFQLADRVSVLRDGQLVGTQRVSKTNEKALITLMINRSIEQVHYKESIPFGSGRYAPSVCPVKDFRISLSGYGKEKWLGYMA